MLFRAFKPKIGPTSASVSLQRCQSYQLVHSAADIACVLGDALDRTLSTVYKVFSEASLILNRKARFNQLAPEVLCTVFSMLPFADLVTASHVCHHWRNIALSSPSIWTEVKMRGYDDDVGPRECLLRAKSFPVSLTVVFTSGDQIRSYLPLIAAHMFHISRLTLTVSARPIFGWRPEPVPLYIHRVVDMPTNTGALFSLRAALTELIDAACSWTAPLLHTFELWNMMDSCDLPETMFSCSAPLRNLQIFNAILPIASVGLFENVTSLRYQAACSYTDIVRFPTAFPNLEDLTLEFSRIRDNAPTVPSDTERLKMPFLRKLRLINLLNESLEVLVFLLALFDHKRLEELWLPAGSSASALTHILSGCTAITKARIVYNKLNQHMPSYDAYAEMTDTQGRVRGVQLKQVTEVHAVLNVPLVHLSLLSLYIVEDHWPQSMQPAAPCLLELSIQLLEPSYSGPATGYVQHGYRRGRFLQSEIEWELPALRVLELTTSSEAPLSVQPSDIVGFLRHALRAPYPLPLLRLRNIRLENEKMVLLNDEVSQIDARGNMDGQLEPAFEATKLVSSPDWNSPETHSMFEYDGLDDSFEESVDSDASVDWF